MNSPIQWTTWSPRRRPTGVKGPEPFSWCRPCLLIVAAILLATTLPAAAEGTDPQTLRPLLLAPPSAQSSPGERQRATVYRSGLTRSIRQLERARANGGTSHGIRSHGAKRETHGRLGIQSRLNARRGELSRINRALGRRDR